MNRIASNTVNVPLFEPLLGELEEAAVLRVLRSGWITAGPEVEAFEAEFAELVDRRHAVALSSCTAALHLACMTLDLRPGDEVIVPSLTFAATANAVHYTGATAVFADIVGEDDLCLDPADVADRVTPRTRAVMAMHYAGFPCDMAALRAICDDHGLVLLEDACHGLGGSIDGRPMGSIGRAACFSFYSNKTITTAEGGMLVTDDEALALRAKRLRSHGQTAVAIDRQRGARNYDIAEVGHNYRMDDLRAAIGRAQLSRLPSLLAERRSLVDMYHRELRDVSGVRVPAFGSRGSPANYLMPVLLLNGERESVRAGLAEVGVQTSVHYPPVHLFDHYRQTSESSLPRTESVAGRQLTLPLFPTMTAEQVIYVCRSLERCLADSHVGPAP